MGFKLKKWGFDMRDTLKRLEKQKSERKRKGLPGFTLVEIIIVLVILGILAAATLTALTGYIDKTREKLAVMEARRWFIASQAAITEVYASHTPDEGGKSYQLPSIQPESSELNISFSSASAHSGIVTSDVFSKVQGWASGGIPSNATDAEVIAYYTLQYMESMNTDRTKNDYKFNDSKTLGLTYTDPDSFFAKCSDDIAVNIYYNEKGKIKYVEFAKRGYSGVIECSSSDNKIKENSKKVNTGTKN